jgi:hypothetical protein
MKRLSLIALACVLLIGCGPKRELMRCADQPVLTEVPPERVYVPLERALVEPVATPAPAGKGSTVGALWAEVELLRAAIATANAKLVEAGSVSGTQTTPATPSGPPSQTEHPR